MNEKLRPDPTLFLKLPYELRLEIYRYTLVADAYISLNDDTAEYPSPYCLQQTTWERTRELNNAYGYLADTTKFPAITCADAEAFLLSNNTFLVQSRIGAETLFRMEASLTKSGCLAKIRNILVLARQHPEDQDNLRCSFLDMGVMRIPGLRAYDILEAVSNFQHLTRVHIRLHQLSSDARPIIHYTMLNHVFIDDHGMEGIKRLAPIIAKLRANLPLPPSLEPDDPTLPFLIRNTFSVYVNTLFVGSQTTSSNDITHFWQPPSRDEATLFEQCSEAESNLMAEEDHLRKLSRILIEKKKARTNAKKRLSRATRRAFENFAKCIPADEQFLINSQSHAAAKMKFFKSEKITSLQEQLLELGNEIHTANLDQAQAKRDLQRLRRATCSDPLKKVYHRYRVKKWVTEAKQVFH